MSRFQEETATDEEIAEEAALYAPFTNAVRELVDVTIRTEVDADEIRAAQVEVEAIVERLRKKQMDGAYGVRFRHDGTRGRNWGNTVMGLRNPIAPPLHIHSDRKGRAWSDFSLGAPYEGPPGLVHGGVIALMLDQVLGHAVSTSGRPGMTGTLTITYRQGTRLGDLRCEAWVDRREGIKTWGKGQILNPAGEVTAEAEGVFILPRWARDLDALRAAAEATESGFEPV
jgi:acyl-coenzyme A thioesterase PaaI-like protein